MGSLFNINNVLVSETAIYKNTALESLTECSYKKSYMSMAYDYIAESTEFYYGLNKKFYKTVLESYGDFDIINEAFDGFIDKVKEIIKKFLEFIKRIFNEFIARLNGLVKSEKYLKNHLKDLNKFTSDHEFDITGYEFTNIREDKPSIKVHDLVLGTSDSLTIAKLSKGSIKADEDYTTPSNFKTRFDDLKDALGEDYYDNVRGELLGSSNGISSSDFAEELFAYFRHNDMDASTITVDSSYVTACKLIFQNYNDLKKSIERTKKSIEREYEDTRKALERMMTKEGKELLISTSNTTAAHVMGIGDASDSDEVINTTDDSNIKKVNNDPTKVRTAIDSYLKARVGQVQMLSNIHSQVFAAKLEAAKDEFNQSKSVLYKALYAVLGKQTKIK